MITPSSLFSVLSDETRLRCLVLLQKEQELCVCEISQILGSTQPKISRHLALLRSSGLVLDKRRGQWVYYSLNPSLPDWTMNILGSTLENLFSVEPHSDDIKKILTLKNENMCSRC
jgi:ArsR family transcriptional regulator